MQLTVLIPIHNEAATLPLILGKVIALPIDKEIIIVDDGSSDDTVRILLDYENHKDIRIIRHEHNEGKGAAVRSAIGGAQGDITIIQDGDLEYDPADYGRLMEPIIRGEAVVVYGTRRGNPYPYLSYYLGGKAISFIANLLYRQRLTDVYTCYKAFATPLLQSFSLDSRGFEWEAEVTAKVAKKGVRIKEVPISYRPRTFAEGKKIRWVDGLKAIYTLFKYRFGD